MTVPNRPLVVRELDVKKLTIGETTLFLDPSSLDAKEQLYIWRNFCRKYTNWTPAEVLDMEIAEIEDVAKQLFAKIEGLGVPKASGSRSKRGPAKKRKPLPAGSS